MEEVCMSNQSFIVQISEARLLPPIVTFKVDVKTQITGLLMKEAFTCYF